MRRRRSLGPFVRTVALALLATACTSFRVQTDYDPATQFSNFQTYAWMRIEPSEDSRIDNALMMKRIRGAVDAELASKGLRLLEESEADLLVVYHAAIDRWVDISTSTRRHGYRRYRHTTDTYVREYDVGSLIIDLVRADPRQLVWRGSGQAQLHQSATPEKRDQRVREAVAAILKDYPPGG